MGTVRVSAIETDVRDGWVTLSARVEGVRARDDAERMFFRAPEAFADKVTDSADPFFAAMLPSAVRSGDDLAVDGEVSWRLVPQARQIMDIWHWREARFKPVSIDLAGTRDGRFYSTAVGAFFSGGVDSFYTLLKNLDFERGSGRVTHLLCVLGFDLWHDNTAMFDVVLEHARAVAAEVGVEVIPVHTNLRAFTDMQAHWQWGQMGAGLAATGLFLGPLLHRVIIPAGELHLPSVLLAPSNALLDPLYSTDSTEFVHDGCEATRLHKVRWRIMRSPLALEHLRVCYANEETDAPPLYNCGRCPKCVRTKLTLHAVGALDRCPTFADDVVTPDEIRGLAGDTSHDTVYLEEVLALLEEEKREPEMRDALRFALKASRGFGARLRNYWRHDLRAPLGRGLQRLRRNGK